MIEALVFTFLLQDPRPELVRGQLEVHDTGAGLAEAVAAVDDGWLGYAVPATTERNHGCAGVFRLSKGGGYTSSDEADPNAVLFVFLQLENGTVHEVRSVSSECRIDPGTETVHWLPSVDASDSIDLIDGLVRREASNELGEHALHTLARHGEPEVTRRLEAFASGDWPGELREKAVFWLGAARGTAGYESLSRLIDSETNLDVREKIVFALHVSPADDSTETLVEVARSDRDARIRAKALFWLAQTAGKQAAATIATAVRDDPEIDVKKKAVFALSQLPPNEGVPLLIEVAETHPQPAIRKKAFFWLGQSGDAQALDLIERILLEPR